MVTLRRANGGHDDCGQRGRQTDLHELRAIITQGLKGIEKRRHQHNPAAHAQQSCQKSSQAADNDQTRQHGQNGGHIHQLRSNSS